MLALLFLLTVTTTAHAVDKVINAPSGDLKLTGSGNVYTDKSLGVGGTPSEKLHVGGSSNTGIRLTSTSDEANAFIDFRGRRSASDRQSFIGYDWNTHTVRWVQDSSLVSTQGLIMNSAYQLGVGISPNTTLHLKAASGNTFMQMDRNAYNNNSRIIFHTNDQTNNDAYIQWDGGANRYGIYTPSGAPSADEAPTERARIYGDSANTYLDLVAPSGDESRITFYRNGATSHGYLSTITDGLRLLAETNKLINIMPGGAGTYQWFFATNGFYFNTLTPMGNGTINATAVYDDGSGPLNDYVFEKEFLGYTIDEEHKDFQRKTLEEEIKYVKDNLHLSTYPGRKEIESLEAGRLSIGKIANRSWETDEVHFLYIKELHERLKNKEAEVAAMKEWICSKDDAPKTLCNL